MKLKKPEVYPDMTSEVASGFFLSDQSLVIGVDEVGRGCLAGPVVAAAAVLPYSVLKYFNHQGERMDQKSSEHFLFEIKDSKMIPEPERAPLAEKARNYVRAYSIQEASVDEIEKLNILYASHLAMERAVMAIEKQLQRRADLVLVDGNIVPKNLRDRGQAIIKGDQKSLTIAFASILAKVYRDDLMESLELQYPGYGLKKHKGYPTPFHKTQILSLGITPIHRKGFKGVLI